MAFDAKKANRVKRFIECLKHTKGEFHGKPFRLLPWQDKIISDVFGTVRDDDPTMRQYTTAYIEIPKKQGKQLALDTPIPTPDGWKRMGELVVGDLVFDERGMPCHVLAMSEIDDTEQCYRITFRDGSFIDAGERHLWNVEYIIGKRKQMQMTTGTMYRRMVRYREHNAGKMDELRSIVRIPVTKPLQTEDKELPIDPYVYGYWLGNGNSIKPELTVRTCDVPVVRACIPYPVSSSWIQAGGGSVVLRVPILRQILVRNFRCKVIPQVYLRASEEQRWALLQGLMDSDGCIGKVKSQSVYVSTIRELAVSVRELLWSLGIKNSMTEEPSRRYNIPTGETLYIIRFTTFEDQPTSRLERKMERKRERVKQTRSCFHYIKDIEPIHEQVPMRCIQVDSQSHQYLAGPSMVPTHNSELGAAIALNMLVNDDEWKAEVYSCASDRQQAAIVFDVACDMVRQSPALSKRIKIVPSTKRMVYMPTGSIYQVLSSEVACVLPETLVQMRDGSIKRADQVSAGDMILSFDGRIPVFDEVVSVREEAPAETLRVTTNHGRAITVTENHPFYRMIKGRRTQDLTHQYEWAEACELKKNDRLAVGLGWPCHANMRNPGITPLEAWALGAWIGDGDCTHFRFINPDIPVIEKMRGFLNSIGSDLKSVYSSRQKETGKDRDQGPIEHIITGNGKRRKSPGREWIRGRFGQNATCHTKLIPECVLTGKREIWAAFLAGYFDTDGCVVNPQSAQGATICSVNTGLLDQVQILLGRLGINASQKTTHLVGIYGRPQLRMLWSFLCPYMVHPRKRERLENMAKQDIHCLQRACESDKVVEVQKTGVQKTISFEMRRTQTHWTNGLITHNTKHGLNVSACIFDELHTQPTRALYDVMTQGSGDARRQPLWFFLTTAGTDRTSICWEVHQKALDILEGRKKDERFYPVIYGLAESEDWHKEENWYKANPSLGYTITIDKVRDAFHKALETPADENMFRQLRLNQWTAQSVRWMPMDKWDECGGNVSEYELEGRACYGGLDLSSTSDLTTLVLVFPPLDESELYIVLPFFWLPDETLALRVRRDHVMYDVWEKQGFLNTTEGNVVHYGFIEKFIVELGERFNIREIGYDRWNASMMVQALEEDGFTMVPFGQGFRDMSAPTKELMRLVLEHRINHGGHPVLRWNMDNAFVRTDPAGNIKIDKEKSTEKVDGAVAMVMALDRAMKNQNGGSVYDTRGLLVLG